MISDINQVQVVAARDGTFYGQPMRHGNICAAAGVSRPISRLIQDGWLASRVQLGQQSGITVDGDGNVVAADWNSDQVNVIAGQTSTVYGRPMIRGHYYLVAGVSDASQPGNGGPVEPRSRWRDSRPVVDNDLIRAASCEAR